MISRHTTSGGQIDPSRLCSATLEGRRDRDSPVAMSEVSRCVIEPVMYATTVKVGMGSRARAGQDSPARAPRPWASTTLMPWRGSDAEVAMFIPFPKGSPPHSLAPWRSCSAEPEDALLQRLLQQSRSAGCSTRVRASQTGWAVRDLNPRPLARHALPSRPEGFDEVRARRHRPRSEAQTRLEAFESVRPESRLGCCSRCCTSRAWIRIPAGSRRVSTKLGGLKYWTLAGNPKRHQVLNGVAESTEVLAPGGLPSPWVNGSFITAKEKPAESRRFGGIPRISTSTPSIRCSSTSRTTSLA